MIAADQARANSTWPVTVHPGRQGALAEDQPAQRVDGHGDRLVGGERLQPAGHGLDRDEHRTGERQREHAHVGAGLDRLGGADHQPRATITHDQA
jgi:hypothetical protein